MKFWIVIILGFIAIVSLSIFIENLNRTSQREYREKLYSAYQRNCDKLNISFEDFVILNDQDLLKCKGKS